MILIFIKSNTGWQFVKLAYGSEELKDVDEKEEDELHDYINGWSWQFNDIYEE